MTVIAIATHVAAATTADPVGAASACGPVDRASAVCIGVFKATSSATAARFSETVLVKPTKIAVILVVAFVAQRVARRAVDRFSRVMAGGRRDGADGRDAAPRVVSDGGSGPSLRRAQRAETIGALLRSVSRASIWSVALLMALAEFGLNLGPLIAGAGIVGVALGFGAQHLVRDFVSGLFMLAEDQYGVGDVIDAGPATGTVEGVSLRTTRLRDVHGTVWHLPNGGIDRVGNKSQQWARAVLDVEVAYDTDIPRASEVIKATADAMFSEEAWAPLILEEPEVWGVENLGVDGIAIRLVLKTAPNEQLGVGRALRARIKEAFDEAGIEIPFPQRTVWHRTADGGPVMVPGAPSPAD